MIAYPMNAKTPAKLAYCTAETIGCKYYHNATHPLSNVETTQPNKSLLAHIELFSGQKVVRLLKTFKSKQHCPIGAVLFWQIAYFIRAIYFDFPKGLPSTKILPYKASISFKLASGVSDLASLGKTGVASFFLKTSRYCILT